MNFSPADPNDVMEADLLAILLGFAEFTAQQSTKIQADGFDQLDDIGIDVLEEQDIRDLAELLGRFPAT